MTLVRYDNFILNTESKKIPTYLKSQLCKKTIQE